MLAEVLDHRRAPSSLAGTSSPRSKSISLPSIPTSGGADLVVVDQLGGCSTLGTPVVVVGRRAGGPATGRGRRSRSCARPASAGRRRAARPCRGSGGAARPTTGRCSRGSRRRASSARPGGSRSPSSRSRAGCPTRGKARKTGVRDGHHPRRLAAPERRVRRHPEQQRQVAAHPVGDVDRLLRVVDADVDVGAEDQLPLARSSRARRRAPGSGGGRRSAGPRRARRDGCPRRRSRGRSRRRPRAPSAAAARSCSPASATFAQGRVATSSTDCISSGFTSPGMSSGRSPRITSIDCDELEALGVADHQLLLDPDRERGAGEVVLQHGRDHDSRGG